MTPYTIIRREIEINELVRAETLHRPLYQGDSAAHCFELKLTRDAAELDCSELGFAGYFTRPDGLTVVLDGSSSPGSGWQSGGVLCLWLSRDCYEIPGRWRLAVKVCDGTDAVTVYACGGSVAPTRTETIVQTGAVPDLYGLLNAVPACRSAAAQALAAAAECEGYIDLLNNETQARESGDMNEAARRASADGALLALALAGRTELDGAVYNHASARTAQPGGTATAVSANIGELQSAGAERVCFVIDIALRPQESEPVTAAVSVLDGQGGTLGVKDLTAAGDWLFLSINIPELPAGAENLTIRVSCGGTQSCAFTPRIFKL